MGTGFVDLQLNGWEGTCFAEPGLTLEKISGVTRSLLARGTLAYCATIATRDPRIYEENLPTVAKAMRDAETGGHILGIHLEGPFISPEPGAVGAHPKQHVQAPSVDAFKMFQEWAEGNIKILTLAPEMPGALELIAYASQNGVVVSLGHHLAPDADMEAAVEAGARLCTHVGNGIPNMIHRHENPLWWQLSCDDVNGLFITDGHHLPADLIKVALRAKELERFIVISDATELSGLPPGAYTTYGGLPVVVEPSGRIYSEQTQSLAGSHSDMLECMNHLASLDLLSEEELWAVGQVNPLKVLGKRPEDLAALTGPDVEFQGGQFTVR